MERRKPNRLEGYDYSACGAYFITICTQKRQHIFWEEENVGAATGRPPLTDAGRIAQTAIRDIPKHYRAVAVDHFVVMPNHIHLLLVIRTEEDRRPVAAPTIGRVVNQLKGIISKHIGRSVFQKSYHDHIIRDQEDYLIRWNYIDTNPARWAEDEYYGYGGFHDHCF